MRPQDAPNPEAEEAIRAELRSIYADLDAVIAARAPICVLSGRCCRFEEYGHTLFLSQPEADLLVAEAPPPARPLDDGATCPWQDAAGRCTARDARPIGCRVYFCDESYGDDARTFSEMFIGRLKRRVEALGLAWNYARLHVHLAAARDTGLRPDLATSAKRGMRSSDLRMRADP